MESWRREPADGDEGSIPQILVGISFPDDFRAREFLTAVGRLQANGALHLEDAVMVVKDEAGHTVVHETTDLQPGRAALSGAMWASLFGLLLGGPVGWLAGGAIGAGAGAVTAHLVDIGISDEWVDWFRQAVRPGTATLALLVTELDVDALAREVERFPGAELVYANLADDALERLRAALDPAAGPTVAPADAPEPQADDPAGTRHSDGVPGGDGA